MTWLGCGSLEHEHGPSKAKDPCGVPKPFSVAGRIEWMDGEGEGALPRGQPRLVSAEAVGEGRRIPGCPEVDGRCIMAAP